MTKNRNGTVDEMDTIVATATNSNEWRLDAERQMQLEIARAMSGKSIPHMNNVWQWILTGELNS